jgi:hypothetical protein
MILLYKPTVRGPIARLDTDDPASRVQAMTFLHDLSFQLFFRDGECSGCRAQILRGDVGWMKPIDGDKARGAALSICRGCAATDLLPLCDALYGTGP